MCSVYCWNIVWIVDNSTCGMVWNNIIVSLYSWWNIFLSMETKKMKRSIIFYCGMFIWCILFWSVLIWIVHKIIKFVWVRHDGWSLSCLANLETCVKQWMKTLAGINEEVVLAWNQMVDWSLINTNSRSRKNENRVVFSYI